MAESIVTIRLSLHEIDYLCDADFLGQHLVDVLRGAESTNDGSSIVRLPRDLAEEFREGFTDELAKVGFDQNYNVTPEGRFLEDLIDRFYVA